MRRRKFIPRWRQFFLCSFLFTLIWSGPALCADVTLAWDPNREDDLEGYGIYFRQGSSGPPYNLAGYVTLDELANPYAPSFTVTGLQEGTRYYFAATAFDVDGNESYYSNSVCAYIAIGGAVSACTSSTSGTSSTGGSTGASSGGSGGDGGCFIASSAQGREATGIAGLTLILSVGLAGLFSMIGRPKN
ncbi:MAG: fibronectin type III domain-containing protein [Desulfobacterales bacterium]